MTNKQETSNRSVTRSDLDLVVAAIDLAGPLHSRLVQIAVILKEVGNLEQRYRDVQRSIQNLEATLAEETRQWEAKRAEYASMEKQREEQIIKLDIVIKDQRQEVARLNDSIKHLRANLEAA
jgi:chromosome segregation ATPase